MALSVSTQLHVWARAGDVQLLFSWTMMPSPQVVLSFSPISNWTWSSRLRPPASRCQAGWQPACSGWWEVNNVHWTFQSQTWTSPWSQPADPLTLLTMVETVLERSQHIIGFSPEAQVGRSFTNFIIWVISIGGNRWGGASDKRDSGSSGGCHRGEQVCSK